MLCSLYLYLLSTETDSLPPGTKYYNKSSLFAVQIKNAKTPGLYRCMGDGEQKCVYEEINVEKMA